MRGIIFCLLVGLPSAAFARPGSPERHPMGAVTAGLGGAGIATSGSAWFNPAGLGRTVTQGLSASMSAYGLSYERSSDFIETPTNAGVIRGQVSNLAIDVFPSSLQYAKPLGTLGPLRHGLGLSVMMPDYDQFDGVLEVPAVDVAFEIQGRVNAETRTYWVLPAWGGCVQRVCFGLGPAVAVHQTKQVLILSVFTAFNDGTAAGVTNTIRNDGLMISLGGQAGLQMEVVDNLFVGLTLRSPLADLYGRGSILVTNATLRSDASTVDRLDIQDPSLSYRQPWRLGLGVAYDAPGFLQLAADVRLSAGLGTYKRVAGPSGELTLPPISFGQAVEDPERAVDVAEQVRLRPMVNVNLGGRLHVSEKIAVNLGMFTDISATPNDAVVSLAQDQVNRIGATLGGGWMGEDIATWLTIVYGYGFGKVLGFGDNFEGTEASLRSHSVHVVLGSTAEF